MKLLPRVFVGIFLTAVLTARADLSNLIRGRQDLEVVSVTDMTPAGRLQRPATPAEPVYYSALSLGTQELGGVRAFEKMPPNEQAVRNISKALAKRGYLPASESTPPPTIALVFGWGTLNPEFNAGDNEEYATPRNQRQMVYFMGGKKLGFTDADFDHTHERMLGRSGLERWIGKSREAADLADRASDNFFITFISAYDLKATQQGQKKKLWITRISSPSLGFYLSEALPSILDLAGPHIGRETTQPVWVNAAHKYKPSITIPDAQLLEYLNSGPLPVLEANSKAPISPALVSELLYAGPLPVVEPRMHKSTRTPAPWN